MVRPKPKRRRRRGGRDGDTEARILEAARIVFLRRGTAGARMQEIAAEAGVNQALLHYYFRSKDHLAKATFARAASQLLPAVIQILAGDEELEAKVARIIQVELDHLSRAPYLPGYILSEINHHPDRVPELIGALSGLSPEVIRPRVVSTLRRQLDERIAAGRIRPIAPDQFIVNLMSLCIFPFAARPMLSALLGIDDAGFARFIARRRDDLTAFFLGALRP
ncbi:MAG TPA: TetR family transcriptional regulator [Vicinamibacterales bacterium]|nr:TetR family transcriptional regulator [Vicinamibacterales bacterium]